jgi:dipeptidyl-peptidase-4
VQVTTDGKKNAIINGLADWVYEEEFEFTQAFQWSPDSRHIAYYRFDESEVPEYTVQFFTGLYPENYTYKYPKVGEKNAVVSIHIYDVNSTQEVTADVGSVTDQYIPRIKWTQDPDKLCIFRMNRWQNKLELLIADASTGKTVVMFTEENKRYINIHDNLTFFNSNKNFIWTSQMDGFNHIYIGNTSDGKLTQVTKGNWDVTNFYGIDEKNKKIFYQSAEVFPLERYVYEISFDGKQKNQLTKEHGWNDAEFNSSYTYMMVIHSDANTPHDFQLYNNKGQVVRMLEDNGDLKKKLTSYTLSKEEFFSFKTADGVQLNGWMIKPWNFDAGKKYPVFMTTYGGPASQSVT